MDWAYKLLAIALVVLLLPSLANAGAATLTWTPPTQNDDDTPLTDLASYEIWHGCSQSGSYDTVEVILAPASTHIAAGLPDTGTCYFAAKATNSVGASSIFSNEAVKVMALLELPGTVDDTTITWQESQNLPLVISNTLPSNYQWGTLALGEPLYIDRSYAFTNIPAELVGLDYLRTANNDKSSTSDSTISFDVNRQVMVFIAFDVRISPVPVWLSVWIDTGMNANSSIDLFNIYSKDFSAGNIALGGNYGTKKSMYSVIVLEQ